MDHDPDVRQFLKRIIPATEADSAMAGSLRKRLEHGSRLMIEAGGHPIGTMGIHGINSKDGVATTGAMIGEKTYWEQGLWPRMLR